MSFTANSMETSTGEETRKKYYWLGWLICGLGALFYSYEYFLRISPSVMSAQIMQHYNINAAIFGSTSAIYYYAYVPMQLPVGMLMDRYGPRRLLTLACFICVLGSYLFVATPSITISALGRFLVGFGSSFAFVGVLKLATIWLPRKRFAMFAGLSAALGTVGAMTGDIIMTHLVASIGWLKTVYFSAAFGVFVTIFLWLFVRDVNPTKPADHSTVVGNSTFKQSLQELAIILSNPQIWIIGLIGCFIYLPTTAFGELWGIPYLEHARHLSPLGSAFGIFLLFLGFTIGAPIMGWLSDRFKTRKKLLLVASIFSTILASILIFVDDLSIQQIDSVLFVLGFMYSAQALVFAVGREISPPAASGTAIAVTNMIVMLGGIVFQPVIGILLDWVWDGTIISNLPVYSSTDYRFALALLPAGIFISAILTFFLKESYGMDKRPVN